MASSAIILGLIIIPCAVIGAILIARGSGGRNVLSAPRCAGCRADLRRVAAEDDPQCPQCHQSVAHHRDVSFRHSPRRKRTIALGFAVTLMPAVLIGAALIAEVALSARQRNVARGIVGTPTPTILATLKANPDDRHSWAALIHRQKTGELSAVDRAAALDIMIGSLRAQPRNRRFLHHSGEFLNDVNDAGDFPAPQYDQLARVVFEPRLRLTPSTTTTGVNAEFMIDLGHGGLPGVRPLMSLERVRVVGGPQLQPTDRLGNPTHVSAGMMQLLDGELKLDLPAGNHQIDFDIVLGLIEVDSPDSDTLRRRGLTTPGPAADWPETRWSTMMTISKTITISP